MNAQFTNLPSPSGRGAGGEGVAVPLEQTITRNGVETMEVG